MAKMVINAAKSPKIDTVNIKSWSPRTIVVTDLRLTVSFKADVILWMRR